MTEITSRDNPRLKQIRKVRDGKDRNSVFIEGLRLAREAMRSPVEVTEAVFSRGFEFAGEFAGVPNRIALPERIFDSLADTKNSQGVILVARRPESNRESFARRSSDRTSLLLNRVNNPANLGAILRTCEAAGVADVIISEGSADPLSAKSLRGSMGSALRLNLWEGAGFREAVDWARGSGLAPTATDISGSTDFREAEKSRKRLIVFGSEANGLSPDELAAMDEVIVIPMKNQVESLNLAVAAGIILYTFAP